MPNNDDSGIDGFLSTTHIYGNDRNTPNPHKLGPNSRGEYERYQGNCGVIYGQYIVDTPMGCYHLPTPAEQRSIESVP